MRVSLNIQPIILIIDSGIGGLSIYTKLKISLKNVQYLYFFDNECFPYGRKTDSFIVNRIISIIDIMSTYYYIDLVVIACNTASVVSLPLLYKKYRFPIVGVLPAIKAARFLTKTGNIGLLATYRTVSHWYILKMIRQFAYDSKVYLLNASELAEIAENKFYGGVVPIGRIENILNTWLHMLFFPDIVILGCTHFYFLKNELISLLPSGTILIDTTDSIVSYIINLMRKHINIEYNFLKKEDKLYCSSVINIMLEFTPFFMEYGFNSVEIICL